MSNKTPTAGNDKASPEDVGHQLAVPSPDLGDSAWVMHGINRLEEKTSRLEGKIDKLEERLRAVEYKISKSTGWLMVGFTLLVIIQIALRFVDISITVN